MKKLFAITFMVLFSVTMTYGQNDAETEQIGDNNEVTVAQVGSNNATAYQGTQKYSSSPVAVAEGNKAAITQDGSFEAFVIQGDAGTALNSNSSIDQSGIDGYAAILQGVYNGGTAVSTNASVVQEESGNIAQIRQGLGGTTEGGSASMTQTGSGNTGIIYQGVQAQSSSLDNTATLTQNGNNNSSTTIFQGSMMSLAGPGSGAGTAEDNTGTIIQNGNSNGTNGDGVRINQGINGGSAFNNTGYILQDGDLNNAIVNQGVGNNMLSEDSDASIYQYSDSNVASVDQAGNNNSATITQN
ncbi:curlin repeat-containing protein [Fodinibius sp.]|uniref:curlin repeat-containing protein n=1 Tax=Fodinibius sp. TaxID=1872440 RepID=UPI002ACDBC0B|nr:curlin repeat-containing protein [Fodinibius sp.]MDZ7659863.1 curlin repeat-containing protein [Fodinibius sp.]